MASSSAEMKSRGKVNTAKLISEDIKEDAAVENLGYQQELKRTFSFIGMLGFAFNIVTSWTALSGVLIVGVESGGPPVMIWSWLGISIVTFTVAYSLAEMCSAYPVAGGQYSWCALLAPRKYARGFSYVCGWFMLIGIIAMGATNNFIGANFVLGMVNLANPEYVIERWQTTLVAYLFAFIAMCVNLFAAPLFEKISRGMLVWNITSFVVVIVTILATNDRKRDAEFVFSKFENFTGFNTSFAAMVGLLQTAFGMCCYDAPAHMVEEMTNARKEAPRAIVWSVALGGVTGFFFLIAVCYCIVDIDTVAKTPTYVPLIQIFYDSTGSVAGACVLTSLILVIVLVASNGLMAEGSRSIYAFSRDRGLPFSSVWSKISTTRYIPVAAILLTTAVQIAMNSIYFGSYTGFLTVVSIATEGFYLSYAMPLLARILGYIAGEPAAREMGGSYSLGRWGVPLNVIGLLFLLLLIITFNFPTINPVTSENMNYTSAAIGLIMVIAVGFWIMTGRKHFTGPLLGGVVEVAKEEMEERKTG